MYHVPTTQGEQRMSARRCTTGFYLVKPRVTRGKHKELNDAATPALTSELLLARNRECAKSPVASERLKVVKKSTTLMGKECIAKLRGISEKERKNLQWIYNQIGLFQVQGSTCSGSLQFEHAADCEYAWSTVSSHDVVTSNRPLQNDQDEKPRAFLYCRKCYGPAVTVVSCCAEQIKYARVPRVNPRAPATVHSCITPYMALHAAVVYVWDM
jgi:hypothetical protein